LAGIVSTEQNYNWKKGIWKSDKSIKSQFKYNVTCLDFGIKNNILRNLNEFNLNPTVLNLFSSYEEIIKTNPSGIFLSNGPGDPYATGSKIVDVIKKFIDDNIPIFGICLGHQILGLALNAKTKKMFQGHRGSNHPVKNLTTGIVEITSQNHGFEVDRDSFGKDIIETHVSLFDGTNEGLRHKHLPVFSVQYHPEASPGPHDSHYLFEEFYKLIILDEINIATKLGYLAPEEIITFLKSLNNRKNHIVLTGRGASDSIINYAELVTEMQIIRHPFKEQGIKAQKCVEF